MTPYHATGLHYTVKLQNEGTTRKVSLKLILKSWQLWIVHTQSVIIGWACVYTALAKVLTYFSSENCLKSYKGMPRKAKAIRGSCTTY